MSEQNSPYDSIAHLYEADHAHFDEDIPFYGELARRSGEPILEAMCGSGRLLLPLGAAGRRVVGLDTSAAMLAVARERIASRQLESRIALQQGDIRDPIGGGPYALAIVGLNSFMHMTTTRDQVAALTQLREALRPGGLLALDLFNPNPRLLAEYDNELVFDREFQLPDGARVQKLVAQQIDAATQINQVTFIYDVTGGDGLLRRHTTQFRMRWIYRYELEHLLARAGFALDQLYGSYDLDEFRSDSDIMLAVARRLP